MAKGQKTGGRQAGTPNKVQREDRELARKYGPKAIKELAKLAGLEPNGNGKAEAEAVRKGALDSILDRAYGKPVQEIGNEGDQPFRVVTRIELVGPDG
jgi:hypothetical protein